ncbi:MAG: hypothetical protein HDQ93_01010 [Desulfovibrio sp.]|nr:hypothetical protein [Desulfovibrio sp.]
MVRSLAAIFALCFALFACGGPEIDKNPAPIVWGKITFAPTTVERSRDKTVYNNISFTGYGKQGMIERVTVEGDETIVENFSSSFYSSKREVFKNPGGDYKTAVEWFFSGGFEKAYAKHNFSSTPRYTLGAYEGEDISIKTSNGASTFASAKAKNIDPRGCEDGEIKNLVITPQRGYAVNIGSISIGKLFIPDDPDNNPGKIAIEGLRLDNIIAPQINAKIGKASADFKAPKFSFALDDVSIPGAFFASLDIPNAPAVVEGSLSGDGQLEGSVLNAKAALTLKDLFDLEAELRGDIKTDQPESIKFVLKETGAFKYITQQQRAQLAMLSLFVPGAQEALVGFFSKPGQTISGSVSFFGNIPEFKFKLK